MIMLRTSFVAAILLAVALPVHAGFIIDPVSATTTATTSSGALSNTYNQNGLSINYTSGVTDFNTYIGENPTNNTEAYGWEATTETATIDYYMGGPYTIGSFALWNAGRLTVGSSVFPLTGNIANFTLIASDDASFTQATTIGSFTANATTSDQSAVTAQVFDFSSVTASYIRLEVDTTLGSTPVEFGQVAFGPPQVVPEPSSIVLSFLGATGMMGAMMWKRRSVKAGGKLNSQVG